MRIILVIRSPEGVREIPLTQEHLTLGRGEAAAVPIKDEGLSRIHASINRQGDNVWVLDEGSTNGTYVNGSAVPPGGTALADGDEVSIGDRTTLSLVISPVEIETSARDEGASRSIPRLALALVLLVTFLTGVLVLAKRFTQRAGLRPEAAEKKSNLRLTPSAAEPDRTEIEKSNPPPAITPAVDGYAGRLYRDMQDKQKFEFIDRHARHISMMMSNQEYDFPPETLGYIKEYLDIYSRRVGNKATARWAEDLRVVFGRARKASPTIILSFNQRGVPTVVGLYIAMIETEYQCLTSPVGARGVFQLMPPAAIACGVDPADRCDLKKSSSCAAEYIKDRIAEFGTDSVSVALGIAGYNRSPDSVRRDLHDVLDPNNKERSFWTLVANKAELDHWFQQENVRYVPKFFAAAIVGEDPLAFGIEMNPLSTYGDVSEAQ